MNKSFFKNHVAERSAPLRLLVAGLCVVATSNIMYQCWGSRGVEDVVLAEAIIQNSIIMHQKSRITSAHLVNDNYHHDNSSALMTTVTDKMPLVIGAGQGTTGTRSMYRAFCHLGIPSVHWDRYCIDKKFPSSDRGDSSDGDSSRDPRPASSSLLSETGLEHHYQAIQTYLRLGNCAILHRRRLKEKNTLDEFMTCTEEEFDNLSTKLHFHVAQVVKSGVIASLHDVPYTQMVPYIMEIAQQESIPTLLILSEREPEKWVVSRTSHHATQTDVVCQDVEHAFDITHCLQKRKDRLPPNNNTDGFSNDIGDMANLFRAYNEFEEGSAEQAIFLDFATKAMAFHQENIRSMSPSYLVNFWTESVDDLTLPEQIWRCIKDMISPHAKKTFIWQSRRFGLTKTQDDKAVAMLEKLDGLRQIDEGKIRNADTAELVESS